MKILEKIKLFFNRDIDEYFKTSRIVYAPIVKGGMWVDHDTALCLSAVFAAVRYISESVGALPWELRQRLNTGGSKIATTHNVNSLIHNRPNPEMSSMDWRVLMLSWANLWGNAYCEIERDVMGRPIALWPIKPDRVTTKRDEDKNLYYEVSQTSGPDIIIEPKDMFHIRGLGSDGITGYSVVALAARSIGAGLASDEFQASFFENGIVTSGVLKHPKALSDPAYNRLKDDFKKKHGGPQHAWNPMILEEGMDWQTMTMPLKDAQFLESKKFTIVDIARWFRVPPHKIGSLEDAHFNNVEHLSIEVVQDTIIPWAIRLEQEANYKLLGQRAQNTFYSKINVKGLLRGDSASRASFYKEMRNMGTMNANEIRDLEDMNPMEGDKGQKYVMQRQYTTLEKVGEDPPEPAPVLPAPNEPDNPDSENNAQLAFRPVFQDAIDRINNRKKNRLRDARKRINKEKWDSWFKNFEIEHEQYTRKTLDPIISGYFNMIEEEADVSDHYVNSFLSQLQ